MATERKILSVGFQFPGDVVEYIPFNSDRTLLDADIIVFSLYVPYSYDDGYRFETAAVHWRSELMIAIESGKTVFVYLSKYQNFHRPGNSVYDNNYSVLPINIGKVIPKGGQRIAVAKSLDYLASYWKEFGQHSSFEVYFEDIIDPLETIFTTKTGKKAVGALYTQSKGTMILLPEINDYEDDFSNYNEETDEECWTPEAIKFGERLLACFLEIDKAVNNVTKIAPAPDWVQQDIYRSKNEIEIKNKMIKIEKEMKTLQDKYAKGLRNLKLEENLKKLLYETGTQLENAIIEALRILGFKASNYRDAESEFDVLFESAEGNLIGEAEGRDNKAISVTKIRQLNMNIDEHFDKCDVDQPAHGVLFGNAFRLKLPTKRDKDFFTEKCRSSARRHNVALVRTTDLFTVAKYLREHSDESYARECRQAILIAKGKYVEFPKPAKSETTSKKASQKTKQ